MNKYDIIVTDTLGMEHRYYIETNKTKVILIEHGEQIQVYK